MFNSIFFYSFLFVFVILNVFAHKPHSVNHHQGKNEHSLDFGHQDTGYESGYDFGKKNINYGDHSAYAASDSYNKAELNKQTTKENNHRKAANTEAGLDKHHEANQKHGKGLLIFKIFRFF